MQYFTRRNAIRILLITIIVVVLRMVWDVHSCLKTNGHWNAEAHVCELKSTKK